MNVLCSLVLIWCLLYWTISVTAPDTRHWFSRMSVNKTLLSDWLAPCGGAGSYSRLTLLLTFVCCGNADFVCKLSSAGQLHGTTKTSARPFKVWPVE
ncbi:hypothetical protein JOB18_020523 [Solea senegalensis]|uniref:Secreted protein n=1 Tax=Solea senegalensis TaxID=28829 RepID=A0AAV6PU93_SOLSE|nr:hypothetical protein JOB18_020523 [Solea senegalensis]